MLEDYLAERAENTEMVIFDRHFTFSLPGVYHIQLQLNLRETVELTSLYEGWDHNTPPKTCLNPGQCRRAPGSLLPWGAMYGICQG